MKFVVSLLTAGLFLLGVCRSSAQNFILTSSPQVGSIPTSVIAVDVNGDQKVDLVTVNLNDGTVTVLTNDGNGKFVFSATLNAGSTGGSIAAADLRNTGRPDLIYSGENFLAVWTNNGNGIFSSNASYAVGNGAGSVIAADVNGDGRPDLICANFDDNTLSVLTNDGHGMFTASSTNAVGSSPLFVAAADVNGDHKIDLISVNWGASSVTILTNNGFGSFSSNASYTVGSFPVSLAAADVNGDGSIDLISANSDDATLSVLTNNGNGAFKLASTLSTTVPGSDGFGPQSIIATDLKGDGRMDLICVDFNDFFTPGTLIIFTNNGCGEFTNYSSLNVGAGPYCVVAADLNGDGQLDLVTANHLDDTLSVLTSVPALTITPTDVGINVMWPSVWTNWVLSQSPDLISKDWSLCSGISDDTTNKSLLIGRPTGNLFFRLSHP